ncbi:decaprenyl-phosphate phosphoribosyltransferase [Pengzhenrongella sp.]|jgi:decaprenyl-phosphate phosphoribosyltransferase|uniref:decaprenyl-phosphate phosphoribosyltransferase n=1 Tax=Pengzhenrongella sp. TaxID=2888820 RepID=UPI002F95D4D9
MSLLNKRHAAGREPAPGSGAGPAAPGLPSVGRRSSRWGAVAPFLVTARPRQWLKNVLVLAAPAAAGTLLHAASALASLLAFASFTLAAIATYFINDALDVDADRRHPVKSRRPVPAGLITPRTAKLTGALCAVASLGTGLILGWAFTALVATYLALTALYSWRLKHRPILDILAVSAGFLLRAAAGGAATGVRLSNWFLLVALFGSLFLVTAKRAAEQARNEAGGHSRATLDAYPAAWLQQVLTMSLTGTFLSYALWAFQVTGRDMVKPVIAASVLPFLALLMRYSMLVATGHGEEPERLVTSDRFLLVAAGTWVVLVGAGIYLG